LFQDYILSIDIIDERCETMIDERFYKNLIERDYLVYR